MGLPLEIEMDVATIEHIDAVPAILNLACEATGMGFAAVARVTQDRWVACSVLDKIGFGLKPGGELVVGTTICDEIRRSGKAVTIDHVSEDAAFCSHPTPAMYGLQSYISVPLFLRNGEFFGTLCAIDPNPHRVSEPQTVRAFELWAELIAFHIEAQRQLAATATELRNERQVAELREQFIAVLGHDLRSPLTAIGSGAKMLLEEPLTTPGRSVLKMVSDSATRSLGIVDTVLDFARARLGGGLALQAQPGAELRPVLEQVIAESRSTHPDREFRAHLAELPPLPADSGRVAQLLSNLLGNALRHGAPEGPIDIHAKVTASHFELSVTNPGPAVPAELLGQAFKPFLRGKPRTRGNGLGLGLYISQQIAKGHGGTLTAQSTGGETRFTFSMPLPVH